MKKFIMLLLISTLIFGVVGCSKTQEDSSGKTDDQSTNADSKDDEKKKM